MYYYYDSDGVDVLYDTLTVSLYSQCTITISTSTHSDSTSTSLYSDRVDVSYSTLTLSLYSDRFDVLYDTSIISITI